MRCILHIRSFLYHLESQSFLLKQVPIHPIKTLIDHVSMCVNVCVWITCLCVRMHRCLWGMVM